MDISVNMSSEHYDDDMSDMSMNSHRQIYPEIIILPINGNMIKYGNITGELKRERRPSSYNSSDISEWYSRIN